jgi:hypothetical protein
VRRKEREERREGEVSVERGTPEDDRHKIGGGNSSMAEITPPNDASLVEERDMGSESACTRIPLVTTIVGIILVRVLMSWTIILALKMRSFLGTANRSR